MDRTTAGGGPLLLGALLAALCGACTFHSTDSTEVGVLTRKVTFFGLLGHQGIQEETYLPGATYTFPALITDWNVFNVALQNLQMVGTKGRADPESREDLEFKTHDGNDIAVDVTVAWRIDPAKAGYLLARVGGTTSEVKEHLVRPACRSIVRDVLNTMTSEEFYVSDKRFAKAEQARQQLAAVMGPEGVVVERVILGEHRFNPEYEKVIHDKKLAEQTAERMVSEGNAALQEALRNLETAKGQVSQQIAKAQGALGQVRLAADADYFKAQREAEAILAEKRARAKGIEKQNAAMSGAGGRTMVKLRLAEALEGKQILFIPSGAKGGALQTMNVNELISRYAAARVDEERGRSAQPAVERPK